MEDLLAGLASLASQKPQEYIATLKSEDGELLPEKDLVERLKGDISNHFKTIADNQYKRGQRERGEGLENYIRSTYGLKSTETGENLIKELVENFKAKAPEPGVELTEENALSHPVVKKLLETSNKDLVREKTAELQKKLEETEQTYQNHLAKLEQDRVNAAVKQEAMQAFQALKIRLRDDNGDTNVRTNAFFTLLGTKRFKLDDNGKPYPVTEKGEPLEDDHYRQVTFADLIKSINPFGIDSQDPNKGSASPSSTNRSSNSKGPNLSGVTPEQFQRMLAGTTGREQRKELLEAYQAELSKA